MHRAPDREVLNWKAERGREGIEGEKEGRIKRGNEVGREWEGRTEGMREEMRMDGGTGRGEEKDALPV